MGFSAKYVMVLVSASAMTVLLPACNESSSKADAVDPPQQVGVVVMKREPLNLTRELPGRTSAMQVADVRPQVSGIVLKRLFVEGQTVRAGQVLYQIDDAAYRVAYKSAQATLRKAEASLRASQQTARRLRELVKLQAVSTQDHENAALSEDQAQAEVGVARAALENERLNLAYTSIVSPIAGRIGKSDVTEGSLVTANQDQRLTLVQKLDPIYVDVNQPSANWLSLKQGLDSGRLRTSPAGATVIIHLENGARYPHAGQLQFSDVTVDPSTGNFLLRAIVPNPDLTLLPGMYVRAVVNEGVLADAVLAPQQAISLDADGKASTWVVDRNGKVQRRSVGISRTIGDQWLVENGLESGERVIVEGVQKVKPDMKVHALPVQWPPASRPDSAAGSAR